MCGGGKCRGNRGTGILLGQNERCILTRGGKMMGQDMLLFYKCII